jgi:ABC-type nitrate/sulfonate/bicarbonate transport system substrate-binding protein
MSDRLLVNVFNIDAALAVGRARGLFGAQELDVEIVITPNSTDQMRGLGKNSWQIASTAFDNVVGWSGRDGAEIVAVTQVSEGITLPIYVRPEIKTWDDLRGKPLAVDAVDTAYALVLRRVLRAHGLEIDQGHYSLIAKGTTGFRLDSMTKGETFAGILNPPWDAKAAVAGMVRFADHREILPDYPGGVYAVDRKWAIANEAALVKYLRVWYEALRWCHQDDNRAAAIQTLAAAEKIDTVAATNRLRQLPPSGRLNLPGLQCALDLRVQFGLAPPMGTDLGVYCDESYYQSAESKTLD